MQTSDLSFSRLRQFLLDLDFSERTGASAQIIFEHRPSDTLFIFRRYEANEQVYWPDVLSVRKQLDERGLVAADSFDQLLRKTSA
jgi:hypothetical protein